MHNPQANPAIHGGRRSRYLRPGSTVAYRKLNADITAERNLRTLGAYLRGATAEDRPSVSSVLRRALAIYADHIRAVASDPVSLLYEKARVREGSKLPTLRKREASKVLPR